MSVNFIAYKTIVRKECVRFLRIWTQTLVPPVITTILYFVIFGELIGARVGEINGVGYMEYIVPGLIMMSVITSSFSNVVASFFSAKFQKYVEELIIAPVANWVVILGYVTGGMLRGILVGLIVTAVSLLFTDLQVLNFGIIAAVLILTSCFFSLAGLLNAIYAKSYDDINIIPTFVITPLTYLGGVFYSLSMLPEFWQMVSKINPIVYMVNAFRFGFLGTSDISVIPAILVLLIINALMFGFILKLLNKGVGIRN